MEKESLRGKRGRESMGEVREGSERVAEREKEGIERGRERDL